MSKKVQHLDRLWSQAVKETANFQCEVCGRLHRIQSHHIISRNKYVLRFDLSNGVCLCSRCHLMAHHDPDKFMQWVYVNRDIDYLRDLKNKHWDKNYDGCEKIIKAAINDARLKRKNFGKTQRKQITLMYIIII